MTKNKWTIMLVLVGLAVFAILLFHIWRDGQLVTLSEDLSAYALRSDASFMRVSVTQVEESKLFPPGHGDFPLSCEATKVDIVPKENYQCILNWQWKANSEAKEFFMEEDSIGHQVKIRVFRTHPRSVWKMNLGIDPEDLPCGVQKR